MCGWGGDEATRSEGKLHSSRLCDRHVLHEQSRHLLLHGNAMQQRQILRTTAWPSTRTTPCSVLQGIRRSPRDLLVVRGDVGGERLAGLVHRNGLAQVVRQRGGNVGAANLKCKNSKCKNSGTRRLRAEDESEGWDGRVPPAHAYQQQSARHTHSELQRKRSVGKYWCGACLRRARHLRVRLQRLILQRCVNVLLLNGLAACGRMGADKRVGLTG